MKLLLISLGLVFLVSSCSKSNNYDEKVLNFTVSAKIKGLDPINTGDTYSSTEVTRVYESLLQYKYLVRPYELEPNLADKMPIISNDGLTYTFKIKKGVLFHNNQCFKDGKGRELKASDFVYSIKRLADAKNNSVGWWLLDGRIKGLNKWRNKYKSSQVATNYDEKVEGLLAIDDYTIQFKLNKVFPQFLYALTMNYTAAVPKEAVEFYGKEFLNNPVGTGPFLTGRYTQSNKIIYTKNPTFRDQFYPSEGSDADKKAGLLDDAGKKLPLVDKIITRVQVEAAPRWQTLEKGKSDFMGIPKDNFDAVVTPGKGITDVYAKKGIILDITPDLDITYITFNHDNPLFKNNVRLKRAMSLAYSAEESNKLFYNNQGILAQTPIPPGIAGYDANYVNPYMQYDLEKAKKLLAEAGYPGGKGLPIIKYDTSAATVNRQMGEYFKKQMEKIGIKIEVITNTWPQLTKKVKTRQTEMFAMAWVGDYPDAENFLQLIYGPNSAPGPNGSNYNNADFNNSFDVATKMQDGPERTKLYKQMSQKHAENVPWILGVHRTSFVVKHSWLKNYKFATFPYGNSKYYRIDLKIKKETAPKL